MQGETKERIQLATVILFVMMALVISATSFWLYQGSQRAACERAVDGRADNRAMWEFLIEQNPTSGDAAEALRREEFVNYLDERLPHLQCIDNKPTPVVSEGGGIEP